ncbi:MAG: ubiquitin-like small modifier protein 1, partial [Chloroflexota bacterium]|nr:ubiquitin-like small modifier protein 1 [Chloroflexota bacterium]
VFQMSVMVRIPTPLRRMTNGKDKVEVESANLNDLVEKLNGEFPGFKDRLVDEEGELRYFVNIYLNGEDVRFMDGLNTSTSSGDEISIVPAVAGGS